MKACENNYSQQIWLGVLLLAGFLLAACDAPTVKVETIAPAMGTEIVMYKSPSCECCTGWAEHLRQAGFAVIESKQEDMDAIKVKYGVTEKLASCHTAIVDGYVIEGHVPAADVVRLLKERPEVAGLTAPGMPMQSPGMQADGLQPKNYNVLTFDRNGKSDVFTRY